MEETTKEEYIQIANDIFDRKGHDALSQPDVGITEVHDEQYVVREKNGSGCCRS